MAGTLLQDALARLDRIGRETNAPPGVLEVLRHPAATLTATLPVRMDDGVQNRQGLSWTLDEVHHRLAETMTRAFDATWATAEAEGLSLRSAAYAVALRRLGGAPWGRACASAGASCGPRHSSNEIRSRCSSRCSAALHLPTSRSASLAPRPRASPCVVGG